jgi:hypothetical protein
LIWFNAAAVSCFSFLFLSFASIILSLNKIFFFLQF